MTSCVNVPALWCNRKINDECRFPERLNVRSYTAAGIKDPTTAGSASSAAATPSVGSGPPDEKSTVAAEANLADDDSESVADVEASAASDATAAGSLATGSTGPDGTPLSYDYELVGVLVHSGSASAGHYYSFIRDRAAVNASTTPGGGASSGEWYEFNDTQVKPFDLSDLAKEAFGGNTEEVPGTMASALTKNNTGGGAGKPVMVEKTRSAYMLFYQNVATLRKRPTAMVTNGSNVDHASKGSILSAVPEYIAPDSTWLQRQNQQLQRDHYWFDSKFSKLLWDALSSQTRTVVENKAYAPTVTSALAVPSAVLLCSQVAALYAWETVARAKQNSKLPMWSWYLHRLLYGDMPSACWLADRLSLRGMSDDAASSSSSGAVRPADWMRMLLCDCPVDTTRALFADFVDSVLGVLAPYEVDPHVPKTLMKDPFKGVSGVEVEIVQLGPDGKPMPRLQPTAVAAGSGKGKSRDNDTDQSADTADDNSADEIPLDVGTVVSVASNLSQAGKVTCPLTADGRPERIFGEKVQQEFQYLSPASPVSVLHGVSVKHAKALRGVHIETIRQLADVTEAQIKSLHHQNMPSGTVERLSGKASAAIDVFNYMRSELSGKNTSAPVDQAPPAPNASDLEASVGEADHQLPANAAAPYAPVRSGAVLARLVTLLSTARNYK